jgi:crotonobetainyl-CoA:carnitine CoA-transferase CaiB-like acyl-CoA transferase
VAQAFGGLTHMTGDPDRPPTRAGLPVADYTAGWVGALGVVLALHERNRSGLGQLVDLALYEPILSMLPEIVSDFVNHGRVAQRSGNEVAAIAPGGTFRSRDGRWVQISASSNMLFDRLMKAVGRPDLGSDPRLATATLRHAAREELMPLLSDWTAQRDSADVLAELDEYGVPCGPVNSVEDLLADVQVGARENVIDVQDAELGAVRTISPLPRLTRTPGSIKAAGPRHGVDTHDILATVLGKTEDELRALQECGVIGSLSSEA